MSSVALELENLFNENQYRDAISLANLNNITPDSDPRSSFIQAACLFRIGEFSTSYEILSQLESALSADSAYLSLMGAALRRLGRLEDAKPFLETALKLQPESPSVRNNLANLLIDLLEFNRAESILNSILQDSPDFKDAHINLSRLHALKGSSNPIPKVQSDVKVASLEQDPLMLAFTDEEVENFGRIKSNQADSKTQDVVSEVSRKFQEMSEPNSFLVEQMRLIERSISENNPSFALELSDKFVLENGFNIAICDCVADALIKAGAYQLAEIYTLHICQLYEVSPKHLINLISLSMSRKDYCIAHLYFDKLVALEPKNPNIQAIQSQLDKLKAELSATPSLFSFKTMLK